jgi:hypothetical protein
MDEVSHAQIYERLIAVENKVDEVDKNTRHIVNAFEALDGAFTVLEWIAKAAKPILWIGALITAMSAFWGMRNND